MNKIYLNNETMSVQGEGLFIRIVILEGNVKINNLDFPMNTLLYFRGNLDISGCGSIKYNFEVEDGTE